MSIKFKKGHIIPRWCHVTTTDRKAQHNCTFGCDVEVTLRDGSVRIYALTDGPIVHVRGRKGPSRKMKGGSTRYSRAVACNLRLDFSRVNDGTLVRMQGTDGFVSAVLQTGPFNLMPEEQWWKL